MIKKIIGVTFLLCLTGVFGYWLSIESVVSEETLQETPTPDGRWQYLNDRLVDPVTGKIPPHIRMREMAYASMLPKAYGSRDSLSVAYKHIGPYNVGGRTRAFAIDQSNSNIYLAGGVSGGMWRSTNAGESWEKVTEPLTHQAVSCIVQDRRSGKSAIWYYGSGEASGNSASKSFSAIYRGGGLYKSIDNGVTWTHLQSTSTLAQKDARWDIIFAVETDPVRLDSDIVYAAIENGIQRSNDGGMTWESVLPANSTTDFADIHVTSTGVFYASISSNGGVNRGFWRSENGVDWVSITPNALPATHERTIIQSAPSNEDIVYFFTSTPGTGENRASLFKYEYLSGDGTGAGGDWTNLTAGLASAEFDVYNGYCQVMNVKPDDENMVFVGGTNLYRSTNGFTDTFQIRRIGGYSIDGDSNYTYFKGKGIHYPDQQSLFFDPQDPDKMISTTDGGIHLAEDCSLETMVWKSLNNGYVTSQFYAIGIDQAIAGSKVVLGGLQDRGTFWSNEADPAAEWSHIRGADGAYCEVEDGGEHYYISTQYANIQRLKIDNNGGGSAKENIMPKQLGRGGGAGWLFVHPFTLDRKNNNILYLPHQGDVWRNDDITATDSTQLFSSWRKIANVSSDITAISSSPSEEGVVYIGTRTGRVYRLDSAHNTFSITPQNLNSGISTYGYVSNIAIDPNDANKAIVVFSNYNTISLWYTEDGGGEWEPIEGNLKGKPDDGLPDILYYIGDGPSTRWVEIIPTPEENAYYVGTSVGLFATTKLDGDSTIWVQQSPDLIGNVVVDMLQYRESDGFLAIGTHGNGIYTGIVNYVDVPEDPDVEPEGVADKSLKNLQWTAYPNPADEYLMVAIEAKSLASLKIELFDLFGRLILVERRTNNSTQNEFSIDISHLASGTYYLRIGDQNSRSMKKIVVQ